MKTTHRKSAANNDIEEFAQIHIVLLQLSGLLVMRRKWGAHLMRTVLSVYLHLGYLFLTTTYVLNFAVGHKDATTIYEGVCVFCLHFRYLVLYWQRPQLAELLQICCKLWAQLTVSEKVIVR